MNWTSTFGLYQSNIKELQLKNCEGKDLMKEAV